MKFLVYVLITASIILGGATVWPYAGQSVFPEKGNGIYWHNLLKSKSVDYFVTHRACPVILGTKWIGNKWIGYDPQWKEPEGRCGTKKDTPFYPNLVAL